MEGEDDLYGLTDILEQIKADQEADNKAAKEKKTVAEKATLDQKFVRVNKILDEIGKLYEEQNDLWEKTENRGQTGNVHLTEFFKVVDEIREKNAEISRLIGPKKSGGRRTRRQRRAKRTGRPTKRRRAK